MNTKGIRILDEKNGVVSVKLQDILNEIKDGKLFKWSILFFDGMGQLGNKKSIVKFAEEVNHLQKGF